MAGDRWSDDAEDRIEWHLSKLRLWVMLGVIFGACYIIGDVLVRVF